MAYRKDEEVLISNALTIYRLAEAKKGWWYCYIKIKGHDKVKKSLRTTSKRDAESAAYKMYYKMRALAEEGLPIKATSWKGLREQYRSAVDYAISTENRLKMLDIFFGDIRDIKDIDNKYIGEYEKKRKVFWQSPEGKKRSKNSHCHNYNVSDTTLRMEMTTLHSILKWAFMRGLLPFVPEFGFFKRQRRNYGVNYNRRGEVTEKIHRKIWQELDKEYKQILKKRENPRDTSFYHAKRRLQEKIGGERKVTDEEVMESFAMPELLKNRRMWIFVHCLHKGWQIRVQEWKNLKFGNVSSFYHDELRKNVLEIEVPESVSKNKRNRFVYIVDHLTIHGDSEKGTLEAMLDEWRSLTPYSSDDDYIFPVLAGNNAGKIKAEMNLYFSKLLKQIGVKQDENGRPITAYSYRHAGISGAIRKGVSVFNIAKAADTSPTQIKRHYEKLFDKENLDHFIDAELKHNKKLAERKRRMEQGGVLSLDDYRTGS